MRVPEIRMCVKRGVRVVGYLYYIDGEWFFDTQPTPCGEAVLDVLEIAVERIKYFKHIGIDAVREEQQRALFAEKLKEQ